MKKWTFVMLLISQALRPISLAAISEQDTLTLVREVNSSFFKISQDVRTVSDNYLDRVLESSDTDFQQTCYEVKEKMIPFIRYLQSLNEGFKSKVVHTKFNGSVKIGDQFAQLQKLAQSAINQCNNEQVLYTLQEFRKELMNVGFTIQRVEINSNKI